MNIKDIRLTREEIGKALREGFPSSNECSVTDYLANAATDKANRWWIEWIEEHSILEQCDPDVMPYFVDYLAVDYPDWQALKEMVKG